MELKNFVGMFSQLCDFGKEMGEDRLNDRDEKILQTFIDWMAEIGVEFYIPKSIPIKEIDADEFFEKIFKK
jgi:hypothetical protein